MHRSRRLAYALRVYAITALLVCCLPLCAKAETAPACTREDGRICCLEDGFRTLTDRILELDAALAQCEVQREPMPGLPPPTPPCEPIQAPATPARAPGRPLLGLGLGVTGTVLLTAAVLAPLPSGVRTGLGTAALGGLSLGVVLVLP